MAQQHNDDTQTHKGDSSMSTHDAGTLGGHRTRELINEGKEHEREEGSSTRNEGFGEQAGRRDTDERADNQKGGRS